jgi:hypothetical protein
MPSIKLTDKTIQGLGPIAGKLTEYRDTEITGLSLRVTPASVKTFNYVYRHAGEQVREKIGRYSATGNGVTLAEAREKARELRRTTELGNDPRADRRATELAKSQAVMFPQLATDYVEKHSKVHKKNERAWKRDQREIDNDLMPAWKTRAVASLTRSDAIKVLNAIHDRGAKQGRERVRVLLSTMWKFAIKRDEYGVTANIAAGIGRETPAGVRTRVLDADKLGRLDVDMDAFRKGEIAAFGKHGTRNLPERDARSSASNSSSGF